MPSRGLRLSMWWLAAVYLLLAVLAASTVEHLLGDGLDHVNNARWVWRGDDWVRFIDHRPPALTLLLLPLMFLYEYAGLAADSVLHTCRLISVAALCLAAVATARALPRSSAGVRPLAALLVACSPLLLALAPMFSQDVCAAAGTAVVLWLQRRLHERPDTARLVALGAVAGAVCMLRFDTGLIVAGLLAAELFVRSPMRRVVALALLAGGVATSLLVAQLVLRFGVGGLPAGVHEVFFDAAGAVSQLRPGQAGAWELYPATWVRTAGPLVLVAVGVGGVQAVSRRDPVALAALGCLLLGGVEYGLLVENAHVRYTAQLIPPAALLACLGVSTVLERLRDPRATAGLMVAVAAWPALLGAVELWAFTDPIYHAPIERRFAQSALEAAGRNQRVWVVGGNYVIRPLRRAGFVEGDISTRNYSVGVGGLNFRLRRPVYFSALGPDLWRVLLDMGHGDVALVFEPVDFRAWPLRRSEGARLLSAQRDELGLRGRRLEGHRPGLGGRLEQDVLVVVSSVDLGTRTAVALSAGEPRSLGVVRLGAGETRIPWDGRPLESLVLVGGEIRSLIAR